jgi:hypothetical protein
MPPTQIRPHAGTQRERNSPTPIVVARRVQVPGQPGQHGAGQRLAGHAERGEQRSQAGDAKDRTGTVSKTIALKQPIANEAAPSCWDLTNLRSVRLRRARASH